MMERYVILKNIKRIRYFAGSISSIENLNERVESHRSTDVIVDRMSKQKEYLIISYIYTYTLMRRKILENIGKYSKN